MTLCISLSVSDLLIAQSGLSFSPVKRFLTLFEMSISPAITLSVLASIRLGVAM